MDKDLRTTKYSFINIIMQLYGLQTYSDMKGSIDFTTAKKYYLKLLDSIRSAIGDTILITDKSHKLELLETIKKYKIELKKAVSFDELDQSMITFQTTLIFLLIGSVPNNTHDPKINRKGKWKLNFYRQIHYTQTAEQKKELILIKLYPKYQGRNEDWIGFLNNICDGECEKNSEKFIEWIKVNNTELYLELF